MSWLCHADDDCKINTICTSVAKFFSKVSNITNKSDHRIFGIHRWQRKSAVPGVTV